MDIYLICMGVKELNIVRLHMNNDMIKIEWHNLTGLKRKTHVLEIS